MAAQPGNKAAGQLKGGQTEAATGAIAALQAGGDGLTAGRPCNRTAFWLCRSSAWCLVQLKLTTGLLTTSPVIFSIWSRVSGWRRLHSAQMQLERGWADGGDLLAGELLVDLRWEQEADGSGRCITAAESQASSGMRGTQAKALLPSPAHPELAGPAAPTRSRACLSASSISSSKPSSS